MESPPPPGPPSPPSRLRPPTPPRETTPAIDCVHWLGYLGIILLLFETPTGFALLSYYGTKLFRPYALEDIWADFAKDSRAKNVVFLKEFQVFEDKAGAINIQTGVSDQLAGMIKRWLNPGQTLAVGNADYKTIIEAKLGIYCLFNDAVMEVMWGLKNLMKSFVPDEKSDLANEDSPRMCQGMKIVLDRHSIYVKPEMCC